MKKIVIFIVSAVLLTAFPAIAQDDELNRLTNIVSSLKNGGEKAYKAAVAYLAADKMWTPMDELGINKEAECRVADRTPGFRLNSVLTNAENAERFQTVTGNHLNGADSRYNYSLFEKTIKVGKTVNYRLAERWGPQVFLFIPFSGKISPSISSDSKAFVSSDLGDGVVKLTGNAVKGLPLIVTVKNDGPENVSYVILNYNSRK